MTTKGNYLGELEELVLITVASLTDQAYGVSIMNYIMEEADRSVNISAIHEVLKRLERKGLLKSKWVVPLRKGAGEENATSF